ncbi:hypothetical protein [Nitrosovibrio tenuis]|uniref:DUF4376 domain-containing protein n=1 Tax=Nitrosovibrio tenuis TaxID=1233 RepID=A0A1H7IPP5_9PROT|nr:hypothetical protein [Nitrosovibrio tenuis]SEK64449.1 hypothetical protein SAMN05216387_102257 [Nitrosovibrio tenuis]
MRMTIIREDGIVGVDGIFRRIDLSALQTDIRAVQWNGVSGHIEYDTAANTPLESIADFQSFIDAWMAAAPRSPAPPPPAPSELKAAALSRINAAYQAAANAMTNEYPEEEIGSWAKQEAEARAWLRDPGTATPWMDAAAAGRGITKAQLAAKIIDNINLYAPAHGALTGKRQKLRDQIAALGDDPTQAQLDAIQW